jgi:DNA polymerase-3 subunit beta
VKIRVERDALADAVAWAARSLPARPPVPVLAGLLLDADEQTLSLSGFDYEVSARVDVEASIDEPGRVLVSGRLLNDIARSLPSRPVELVTEGQKVVVTCGSARFTLLTLPVEDYPSLPEMPGATGTVAAAELAAAVAQVSIAAGRDDTLPVLTGVRVEIEGQTVTLAATDRYRLAVRELAWTPEESGLSAVALAATGTGEGLVGFEGSGRRTTSRLLDGEFPKYRSLLPSESASVATIETAAFVESVKRVALVAERNTPVRLAFSDGMLTLEAGTGDEAQASESIEATLDGDAITIAFNPGYLLDGLGALDAPYARLSFTTPTKPAVLVGAPAADGESISSYRYLLMPVRLSG